MLKRPMQKAARVKPQKPPRSYRAVIESIRQVWRIEHVNDVDAIWLMGKAAQQEVSGRLRIGVWNLCKGAGGILFEHEYRMLCYQTDMILAQEALLSEKGLKTFCEDGFEVRHAASYKRLDGLRDGVMTASRFKSGEEPRRLFCKFPEPVFKTPKVALMTTYAIAGTSETLMVVNIHAKLVRRLAGAGDEIRHILSQLPHHQGPMIFAGDFNTFTPGYLGVVSRALQALGLKFVEIKDDPRSSLAALDYVFVRGLEVESIVVDTTFKNSDHFPVILHAKI